MPVERRDAYLAALEDASVRQDIGPYFLGSSWVKVWMVARRRPFRRQDRKIWTYDRYFPKSIFKDHPQEGSMPEITIEQTTFERLQRYAVPFVDTPDMVIVRALDALDGLSAGEAQEHRSGADAEQRIDPRALPRLTHTKVLEAAIDGEPVAKPNWNLLLDQMLRRAKARVGSFEKLRQVCPVNMVEGRKEDEGYGYLSDIGVSVQGQDANGACRATVLAAQALNIGLEIGFMWRLKEAAAFPGERARIRVPGGQQPPKVRAA